MATCEIHREYPEIKCHNSVLTGDRRGFCILHSWDETKDQAVFREDLRARWERQDSEYHDFRGVFFPSPFDPKDFFGTKEFNKTVDFSWATFIKNADFSEVIFTGGAKFYKATFAEEADFSGTTFMNWASFFVATYREFASYTGATFLEEANFSKAKFAKLANFGGTTFAKEAHFSEADFATNADFSWVKIKGRVVFWGLNPSGSAASPRPFKGAESPRAFRGEFKELELSPGAVLRFQDLSLAKVEFRGTDLRDIEYHNITWHSYSNWFFRKDVKWLPIRQAVYDEVLLDKKEPSLFNRIKNNIINIAIFWKWPYIKTSKPDKAEYARVEELYRYLRINYEKKGDYKNAGDFHYGEMEMHRRASPWRRWFLISWYNTYRFLSGYGERPLWALIWLIMFLFGLSGLVQWSGLAINDYGQYATFGNSLLYILQKASLQRPDWPKPATFGGQFYSSISVLLIPGQAALFLLALRNRLGRRR
ncbi:MAG: pentapeptide repeat-containing protein [Desulfobaccales bacterium]